MNDLLGISEKKIAKFGIISIESDRSISRDKVLHVTPLDAKYHKAVLDIYYGTRL